MNTMFNLNLPLELSHIITLCFAWTVEWSMLNTTMFLQTDMQSSVSVSLGKTLNLSTVMFLGKLCHI